MFGINWRAKARMGLVRLFGVLTLLMPALQAASADTTLWRDIRANEVQQRGERLPEPLRYRTLSLDFAAMRTRLADAPLEANVPVDASEFVLALPMPGGQFADFRVVESPIMESKLASKYPMLKTYLGQGIDDPTATVRFDLTNFGFRAQIIGWRETVYIEPLQRSDTENYRVFSKDDYRKTGQPLVCSVTGEVLKSLPNFQKRGLVPKISSGANLRTYRLAMAATGEYTVALGGTVLDGLSGIVTTMNRVNGIYEREVSARMVLVANNDSIIYTNAATDPYANTSADLAANQTNLTNLIGSANYDIGHLVGTGGGGVASLRSVCAASFKAQGLTGSPNPIADAFDVDYVAHEIGHQFGGNHTFNGSGSNCSGGNRNAGTAYEPGSGITIQAYAGICGGDNLQPNSEDYFHRVSLNEILAFTTNAGTGGSCGVLTSTGNGVPTVSAPAAVTIPISTPFRLTATGSDPNGDALTYVWEQFDLGTANPEGSIVDTANRPIFRSFDPTPSPTRIFPSLRYILNNANVAPATAPLPGTATPNWLTAEVLPTTGRTMNFRVTARDNRAGGGGTNEASVAVTSTTSAGPFIVTAPDTAVSWAAGSSQSITWNVAGTTANGVNTANVEIALSRDGGLTFPTILAASTPNDGTETLTIPAGTPATTQARIRVAAVGNIFFDIGNANFTVTGGNTAPTLTGITSVTTRQGSPAVVGNIATVADAQDLAGSLSVALSDVPPEMTASVVNTGGTVALTAAASCTLVTPTSSNKTYPIQLTVTDSAGASTTLPVNVLVGSNQIPTLGTYSNLSVPLNSSNTATPSAAIADANNNLTTPTVSPSTLPGGGTITIAANGTVTITTTAATVVGTYTLTAQANDTCGAVRIRRFNVTVQAPELAIMQSSVLTGNNLIEPNECNQLNVSLSNTGTATATAVSSTLSTSTPNVSVTQAAAAFPDIPASLSGTSLTPFQVSTAASLVCGTTINFDLNVSYAGGGSTLLPFGVLVGRVGTPLLESFDTVTAPALPSGWTTEQSGTSPPPLFATTATSPDSSPNAVFTNGNNKSSTNSLRTPAVTLPSGSTPARLIFRHAYNFELSLDGGILELSSDGGTTWNNVTSAAVGASFTSGGYTGVISAGSGNPLGGQSGWSGVQSTYITSTVQLPVVFNGQTVRFRFHAGWDNNGVNASPNWRIDGVVVEAGFVCSTPGSGVCGVIPTPSSRLAVGSITLPATGISANRATRVQFSKPFSIIPVVIAQPSDEDADPQSVRISNITANGFDALQVEAPGCAGCTGAGSAMTMHWLAAVPGSYRLPIDIPIINRIAGRAPQGTGAGALIKADRVNTALLFRSTTAGGFASWAAPSSVAYNFPVSGDSTLNFSAAPIVLTGVQTWANEGADLNTSGPTPALTGASEPWLTSLGRAISATGATLALDVSEVDDGGPINPGLASPETIGIIAIESGVTQSLTTQGGPAVVGLATGTQTVIDTCSNADLAFPAAAPLVAANLRGFAAKQTRTEDDGGWTRRCSMSSPAANTARLSARIDEDADIDPERGHGNETIGALIFGGDFVTSPVSLAKLDVQRAGSTLDVRFSTASEVGHLGSRIWGRSGPNAEWRALHDDLIVGDARDAFVGKSYQRSVSAADVSEIRIEDVDLLGRSRFHEPIAVGQSKGSEPIAQPIDWRTIRSANLLSQPALNRGSGADMLAEVRETGIQRVSFESLQAAGWTGLNADINTIAVLDDGRAVARAIVCGSANFAPGCSIEWLGTAAQTLYGKANFYTIGVSPKDARSVGPGALVEASGAPRRFTDTLVQSPNRQYSFSAPVDDPWFDERVLANNGPAEITRTFALPGRDGGPASLTVSLWGGLALAGDEPDHSVQVLVNDVLLESRRFDGLSAETITVELPETLLQASNTLRLRVPRDTGYALDLVLLDGFSVSYTRSTGTASDSVLAQGAFTATAGSDTLFDGGFETRSGVALTALNSTTLWAQIKDAVYREAVNGPVAIDARADALIAATAAQIKTPLVRRMAAAAGAPTLADYLIISHPQFVSELAPLISLQQARGYRVQVLQTDAIYARSSDHAISPLAIRDAITQANPRFVLLVGGDSYDYDDNLGLGSQSFIPSFYRVSDPIVRFALSDALYGDSNSDGIPERAIGRIPARTNLEAQRAITAILARANAGTASQYFSAAGKSAPGENFGIHARAQLSYLRQNQPQSFGLVDEIGLLPARAAASAALAGSADWVNYIGHSSPNRWAFDNLLDTNQLAAIGRIGAPAIVTQWGCWNSYFAMPSQDTMGHALMLRSNSLAAAVIGSSSLAEDASHMALSTRFFDLVEDGRFGDSSMTPINTIGEALMAAKANLARTAPEHVESNYSITLFGDPAQNLR